MLRVPIAYAKPGMVLAMPIVHPRRPDTILLKDGITLDAHSIGRLAEINARDLWIRYPGTEFLCEYYCPEVFRAQARLTARIGAALDAISGPAVVKLEYNDYRTAVSGLIDRLLMFPRSALFLQELADRDQPALRHAAAVCMLSVLMGLKLDDYLVTERTRVSAQSARDVAALGVGAMFHDVGMLRLDPAVVQKWRQTNDESDPAWQRHTAIGFEMVKDAIGPVAAAAVLHHHQKHDGSGFPRRTKLDGSEERLKGHDIHIYARIVAAADLFDRLRHPYQPTATAAAPVPVVRVLNTMRQRPYANWLDPMVFRALLAVVPAFAPGSLVTLSDGRRAVVTEWFADDPCRPNVQILADDLAAAATDDTERQRITLARTPELTIVESDEQDVASDCFYPEFPGQFDLRLFNRALFNAAVPVPGPSDRHADKPVERSVA